MNTLFGLKSDMSTRYDASGKRLTVTSVKIDNHVVVGHTSAEKVGYSAVVLGVGSKKKAPKAETHKYSHLSVIPRYVREVRGVKSVEAGAVVTIQDVLSPGDLVSVTGVTKGKGFTGVVKRYNFRGGPKTHGQSDRHRARGSLGSGTTPGRVFPGLRMAGRSGGTTATVRNLVVLHVNPDSGEVLLSGPIPGHRNTLVQITKTGTKSAHSAMEMLAFDTVAEKETVASESATDTHVEETVVVDEKASE